ncbi:MAG: PspA/IM30 family protein, partial [Planctomycetaceae bacterium]
MTFFSRLTDIVTCNLTELLSNEDDPQTALQQIVNEMEEGVAGAKRSVSTATANEQRLGQEVQEQSQQAETWQMRAKGG